MTENEWCVIGSQILRVQVGAPDPAAAGGERASVRRALLPPQRDLGPQVLPLRPQALLHGLHVWYKSSALSKILLLSLRIEHFDVQF